MLKTRRRRAKLGFTLIELLVVIAIIAILVELYSRHERPHAARNAKQT